MTLFPNFKMNCCAHNDLHGSSWSAKFHNEWHFGWRCGAFQRSILKVFACATFARLQAFRCAVKRALHTKIVQKSHINPWLMIMWKEQCVRFHWHCCHSDCGNEWYLVEVKPLFVAARTSVFVLSTFTTRILYAKNEFSCVLNMHITVGRFKPMSNLVSHSKTSHTFHKIRLNWE